MVFFFSPRNLYWNFNCLIAFLTSIQFIAISLNTRCIEQFSSFLSFPKMYDSMRVIRGAIWLGPCAEIPYNQSNVSHPYCSISFSCLLPKFWRFQASTRLRVGLNGAIWKRGCAHLNDVMASLSLPGDFIAQKLLLSPAQFIIVIIALQLSTAYNRNSLFAIFCHIWIGRWSHNWCLCCCNGVRSSPWVLGCFQW